MRAGVLAAAIVLLPLALGAQTADPEGISASKFEVRGDRVIYDTERLPDGRADMLDEDLITLAALLQAHPGVTTLQVNSGGGSVWAAERMANLVIDRGLDTHVDGICMSSCVTLFLGGAKRTMADGARIGFHQTWWAADAMERFYNDSALRQHWDTPFDFAEWLHESTQRDVYERLVFMVSRGVEPTFAIETLRMAPAQTWEPWRGHLLAGGVLTE